MKINLILPKSKKGKKMLQDRIDEWHADCIIRKINELNCSYERKVELLEEIKEDFTRKGVS